MIYKKKRKGICFIFVLQIYELYLNCTNILEKNFQENDVFEN